MGVCDSWELLSWTLSHLSIVENAVLIKLIAPLFPVDAKAIKAVKMHGVSNESGNGWIVDSLR